MPAARVVEAHAHVVELSLSRSVANAKRQWDHRRLALVHLRADDGPYGLGEASPLPGFSPDAFDDVLAALRAALPTFVGAPLDALSVPLARAAGPLSALPSARFALETAALDLAARSEGVPFAAKLVPEPSARVATAALAGLADDGLRARGVALVARGYRTLKVKIGVPGALSREREALSALRDAVGPSIRLRLDANGSLPPETLSATLAALGPIDPEYVEEPTPRWPAHRTAPPWFADEGLLREPSLANVDALASRAGGVVLKPALLGLHEALSLGLRARALGLSAVASHLFDGPVALAATAALALALGGPCAHGIAPHDALAPFGSLAIPGLEVPGAATLSSVPGLGLSLEALLVV